MRLTFDGLHFICHCTYDERLAVKEVGFDWRPDFRAWMTTSPMVASHFRKYADELAENKFKQSFIEVTPWVGRIRYPKGKTPLPFQVPAAEYALSRNRSYLALDPGLGKTICMALVMNALEKHPVVILTPSGLALNIEAELNAWLTWQGYLIEIYEPGKKIDQRCNVLIVPDVFIGDTIGAYNDLRDFIHTMSLSERTIFIDEAQRYGNMSAQRTRALLGLNGLVDRFSKVVFMSGTPLRKRPLELHPILSKCAPETIDFRDLHRFGMEYCGGYYDGFGYNYKGASNTKELGKRMREKFMLRLRKKDVLKDLPAKTEEIIFIGVDAPPVVTRYEKKHLAKYSPEDLAMAAIAPDSETSTYRRLLGHAKVKPAASFIQDILDGGDERLLIFCEHIEVVDLMAKALKKYKPLVIGSKTSKKVKHETVSSFQTGKHRVLVCNPSMRIGYTLTKASRVIHLEPSWVDTDNEQASDRAHRIGQKENVLVQYLCFKNSMDRKVIESNMATRTLTALI